MVQPQKEFRRSEAFFGRRKTKKLSDRQQELMDRLLPQLGVDVGASKPDSLDTLFRQTPEKVVLEIGFGGGEHLVHQAVQNPQNGYIGVEPFVNSMAKALASIEKSEAGNIRLYDEDATELLDWLPDTSVDRIDLLYPDPWHKRRHWKRRFVNEKNLTRFARVVKPGGVFRFASDIESYINWTLDHCHQHPSWSWQATNSSDWKYPYQDWIRTRYEAKAVREGRTPCYLRFQRI